MKWYFACNSISKEFFPLIKAAVNSAIQNTTLVPHFIYDGKPDELTAWLEERGVKIIYHRVSFYDKLKLFYRSSDMHIPTGAYLRCDIPTIETEDDFILYTDCDVLFLKDFDYAERPEYFACSSQFDKNDFRDFNTGVMVMNLKKLRESNAEFSEFIIKNMNKMIAFDQTAFQIFYDGKNTALPVKYNHKPYWGIGEEAVIVHFHGPKPLNMNPRYLYDENKEKYDYYFDLLTSYNPDIEFDFTVRVIRKTPLHVRLQNRFWKEWQRLIMKCYNCK